MTTVPVDPFMGDGRLRPPPDPILRVDFDSLYTFAGAGGGLQ